jgi:signal transduction histidine kinase/DNA-binding response OmpR family regulator
MRPLPAVSNFEFRGDGEARLHWTATRTESGRILASGPGLVAFDGGAFRSLTYEGSSDWASLSADPSGRIWAGARDEFGVFEPDAPDSYRFRSLTSLLPEDERDLGDILHAFAMDDGAAFVCRERVVWTNGVHATSWHVPSRRRLYAWEDGGRVYVGGKDGHVFRITPTGLVHAMQIPSKHGISWTERIDSNEWLAYGDGGLVSPSEATSETLSEVNRMLEGSAIVCYMRVPDGRLAIGTYYRGVFLIDTDSGEFEIVDDGSGMPTNSVTGFLPGGSDWLWVVTTHGLSRMSLSDAVKVTRSEAGLEGPSVHFVESEGDSVIIGTNAGRFVLSGGVTYRTFRKIDNEWFGGPARIGDTLLCGGMSGIYKLAPEGVERLIPEVRPVWIIVPSKSDPALVHYATSTALRAARWSSGELEVEATMEFGRQIRSIVASAEGDLWVVAGETISRVTFDASRNEFAMGEEILWPTERMTPGSEIELLRIGDAVVAVVEGELLELADRTLGFVPVESLNCVEIVAVTSGSGGETWALARPAGHKMDSPRLVRLSRERGAIAAVEMETPGAFALGSLATIHFVDSQSGAPELWMGAKGGIVRVDIARVRPAGALPTFGVRMSRNIEGTTTEVASSATEFPFNPGPISFRWSAPDLVLGDVLVETRIAGAETGWTPAANRNSQEFARLADGSYAFEVRAVDALGRPGPLTSRAFTVLPPWYRTTTAVTSFCVTALAFGWIGWQLRMRASRRRAEQLEGLVEDRTRELERVNAEKTRFIARMNHEIRNPLNGLLGAIGILEQYSHRGREARMVQILRACADHLGAVVEDVLDFSSIEGGRIVVQDRAVSIAAMLEAVPRMLHAESERTGTEIITTIAPDVPAVVIADPDRIRQILMNFVGNALKYAPGEPVHVEVTAASVDGAQSLRFAVRDHGPGISEADKPMLFSMFERGKGATGLNARGMGIGLATCRLLARRMGGEVGVISGLGEGSEFYLKLPLKVEAGVTPLPETQPQSERFKVACLIVEDQEFNRVILKDMLDRFGCKVDEAPSAETALRLAAMNRYDVVFTDLELPDAAPGEILNMLRNQQSAANTAVPTLVVTTAYATENVRQMCLDAGATAFLAKPLSSTKVLAVLREIDAARRPAPSVEAPVQERAVGTENANVAQLARIRGCSVESVATEIASNIADEVRLLRTSVKSGNSRETAHHAHRLLSLSALAITPELAGVATGIQHDAREGRFPAEERLAALDAAAAAAREILGAIKSGAAAGGRNRVPGRNEPTASSRSD